MIKELEKEIKESQSLGRRQRRKKEKQLQKKYNNKNIRIKSHKTFKKGESLKREQRRQLIKDKTLLKEVIKITRKYFPNLTTLFSQVTDKRHKSYITYNIRTIITARLLALICEITTINEVSRTFNTEEAIKTYQAFVINI